MNKAADKEKKTKPKTKRSNETNEKVEKKEKEPKEPKRSAENEKSDEKSGQVRRERSLAANQSDSGTVMTHVFTKSQGLSLRRMRRLRRLQRQAGSLCCAKNKALKDGLSKEEALKKAREVWHLNLSTYNRVCVQFLCN